jgi:ribosomal-protein-alanine N-acetyltransferase
MVKIRKFLPENLERVVEIERASFPQKVAYSKSHFEKLYKQYPDGFFVAWLSERMVGYIVGYIPNRSGYIDSIAIDPNYRLQGIGKNLTNSLLDHFKEKRVRTISLNVRTKNKTGIAFYQKLGFKILKTIKNFYRNGDDAYLMKREI